MWIELVLQILIMLWDHARELGPITQQADG